MKPNALAQALLSAGYLEQSMALMALMALMEAYTAQGNRSHITSLGP